MAEADPQSGGKTLLPQEPIHAIVEPLKRFLHIEAASGFVLIAATITALVLANSPWSEAYLGFWKTHLSVQFGTFEFDHSLKHLLNDGLMVIFFFVIGLEVKREMVLGELRDWRGAILPIAAALGGMILPAGIYLALQSSGDGMRGWGIPMATDIAFVVGCLAVLGSRVPHGLRVLLLSLAIVDDIGAILVIAIGYTDQLYWSWLIAGLVGIGIITLFQRVGVRAFAMYVLVGVFVWYCFHESGVHATIAGVIIGVMTPARPYLNKSAFGQLLHVVGDTLHGDWEARQHRTEEIRKLQYAAREAVSPLEYLEYLLHPWVGFVIMPLFALANAGVILNLDAFTSSVAWAIVAALFLGKPLGVLLLSWLVVQTGYVKLPQGVNWLALAGGGCLAGIGFTMAIFIDTLAFKGYAELLAEAKVGILAGSVFSAVVGMLLLIYNLPDPKQTEEPQSEAPQVEATA